jgi:porin
MIHITPLTSLPIDMKRSSNYTHRYSSAWILKIVTAGIFLVSAIPLSLSAQSNDAAPKTDETIWTRDTITGDWRGSRTKLSDKGFDFDFRLSQYYQDVTSGGVNQNGEYGGTMDYRLTIDGDKLFGAKGWSLITHFRTRFGQDVNADAGTFVLQNAGMVSQSPNDYHGTNMTGLMFSKFLPLFGKPGNLTFGKLDAIDLVTGFFPHLGYGQEGFWNANSMVSALPWFGAVAGLSLWGGMAVTINQDAAMAESGFLTIGTTNVATHWGSIPDAFDDGVWLAGFHRFFWKKDDKPGYFMVFGGYSTKEQGSNDPHDLVYIPGQGIENTDTAKPWDIALYLYQEVWQAESDPNRKVFLFMGGTVGPDNPQFAQWNFFANVEMFGPKASRPHDRMGAALWFNGLSPNYKNLVSPVADLRNLWGLELYYNIALTPWLHLSPDIQLVKNEWQGDDLAFIPGIRLVMDF